MNRFMAFAVGLVLLLSSVDANAEKAVNWKNVGNWSIRVDTSLENGCFLYAQYEGGTQFRFGFDMGLGNAYFLIGNGNWKSLEEGKTYTLVFQFDNRPRWTGEGRGYLVGENLVGLVGTVSDGEFFSELARSHVLTATYKGREIARLNLKGSYAAVKELLNCQAEMRAARAVGKQPRKDPFAPDRATENTRDPFAQ